MRCHTRYCDAACQHEHWANGHKKKCKKIARGGGAEQYHADKKFKEAADAAVVACCACRGTMGLAHVACLVRQAEMEVKRKEEWNDGEEFAKWERCFDCGQRFHGAVAHALGWAGWKTYGPRRNRDAIAAASSSTRRCAGTWAGRRRTRLDAWHLGHSATLCSRRVPK